MTNETFSSCCGATAQTDIPFNEDGGFCSECRDHCDYHQFEDADGEPVKQYVLANGMLSDTPPEEPTDYSLVGFLEAAPKEILAGSCMLLILICVTALLKGLHIVTFGGGQ